MTDLTPQPASPLHAVLADPARLAEIDVDKIEKLMDMQLRMDAERARREFAVAFRDAQAEIAPVVKRGHNRHTSSDYARLEEVAAAVDPAVQRHGFSQSISTEPSAQEDHTVIVLTVRHAGGHEEKHRFDAPLDYRGIKGSPSKTRLHGAASSLTYAKRILKLSVWDVQFADDDDGNAAAGVGPGAAKISDRAAAALHGEISEVGADVQKFCDYFGVDSVESLPAARLGEARSLLDRKRQL